MHGQRGYKLQRRAGWFVVACLVGVGHYTACAASVAAPTVTELFPVKGRGARSVCVDSHRIVRDRSSAATEGERREYFGDRRGNYITSQQ